MVKGLDRFKEAFKDHQDNYIIIGGTACDMLLSRGGLNPRATKDIDIVLIIESLTAGFVTQLWKFLDEGRYKSLEKEPKERKYYRFSNPSEAGYPKQIELFSRTPDAIDGDHASRLTRINVEGAVNSLSAILMDDAYYKYTVAQSSMIEDVHVANAESLICLKAKAYLDLEKRKKAGEQIDEDDIKKHKSDVFRIAAMLKQADHYQLTDPIRGDMQQFLDAIKGQIPSDEMLKHLGAEGVKANDIYIQLYQNFGLSS